MKIFDAHFHIDKGYGQCAVEVQHRNVIFNSLSQYRERAGEVNSNDVVTLVFDFKNDPDFVRSQIAEKKIKGIKIHSKIQQIADEDYPALFAELKKTDLSNMVVTVDAFYWGHDYAYQPNLKRIIELVELFPQTPFVIAHSGSIKVLEYFLHLRTLPNVYFDLSLSLAYLKYASVMQDFKVMLKFGNPDRIVFGTDYPAVTDKDQLDCFLALCEEVNMSEESKSKILFDNAYALFKTS